MKILPDTGTACVLKSMSHKGCKNIEELHLCEGYQSLDFCVRIEESLHKES